MGKKQQNLHFQSIIGQAALRQGRRNVLKGGLGLSLLAVFPETMTTAFAPPVSRNAQPSLGFEAVQKSLLDDVLLPEGYKYTICMRQVIRWRRASLLIRIAEWRAMIGVGG